MDIPTVSYLRWVSVCFPGKLEKTKENVNLNRKWSACGIENEMHRMVLLFCLFVFFLGPNGFLEVDEEERATSSNCIVG